MRELLVDANVLLRYLTNQPPHLANRAATILETAAREDVDLVVPSLILAEVVYVLDSVYTWDRPTIATRLLDLVTAGVIVFLEQPIIEQTIVWYRDLPGLDFADAYLAASASARRDSAVASFDRHLRRVPGITVIQRPEQIRLG